MYCASARTADPATSGRRPAPGTPAPRRALCPTPADPAFELRPAVLPKHCTVEAGTGDGAYAALRLWRLEAEGTVRQLLRLRSMVITLRSRLMSIQRSAGSSPRRAPVARPSAVIA